MRYAFRITHKDNIPIYLADGEIRSRAHVDPQLCTQVSYGNIINRRGDSLARDVGFDINSYVPFYFSPATSMAYVISRGKVPVRSGEGVELGMSTSKDMIFIVTSPSSVAEECGVKFSNRALNKLPMADVFDDISTLEQNVQWHLFDETPRMGRITEIGYQGVGKYFRSTDIAGREQRGEIRSAEFLVQNAYPMRLTTCIVTQNQTVCTELTQVMTQSSFDIPVYLKPDCFYS